jgi:hypothetical protein
MIEWKQLGSQDAIFNSNYRANPLVHTKDAQWTHLRLRSSNGIGQGLSRTNTERSARVTRPNPLIGLPGLHSVIDSAQDSGHRGSIPGIDRSFGATVCTLSLS